MNIIKEKMTKIITNKIDDVLTIGAIHLANELHNKEVEKINNSMEFRLIITQKKSLGQKRNFVVTDETGFKKYEIKTDCFHFGYPRIRLYDLSNEEIAYVEKDKSFSSKTIYKAFQIYLEDDKLGCLMQSHGVRFKMDFDLNGWHLEGDLLQHVFNVYDKNSNLVLQINTLSRENDKDTYDLRYNSRPNELIGLLFVMAIELSKNDN